MTETLLYCLLMLLMVGLAFTVLVDGYIRKAHRNVMRVIVALIISLFADDWLAYCFDLDGSKVFVRTLLAVYSYSARPVLLILCGRIVSGKPSARLAWSLAGLNALIHVTAFFSGISFYIDPRIGFQRGPLGYTSHIVSTVLFAQLAFFTFSGRKNMKGMERFILLFNAAVIVAAVAVDTVIVESPQPVSFMEAAMAACSLFYYIWLHLQFVREHERALMAGQRMQVMLSQIQPHFLYNALAVIQNLCHIDPPQAEAATVRFARYLRGNMDSLRAEGTISFERELTHTREYLELEKMRFREKLAVRYEIECVDFELPLLTLQPIAENAVRHGVRGNPDGAGTVTIATREYPDRYEIIVTDNGAGFDTSSAPQDEGRAHSGIQNVRERLASLRGGTLTFESSIGTGTKAVIALPKEANAK